MVVLQTMLLTFLLSIAGVTTAADFQLNIYHTNDIHARYNESGATEGGKCSKEPCYGGMARHATFLKESVDSSANNLLLSAGDWFTGTTYFSVYQGNLTSHYLNTLKYDAWALGNHEFDRGSENLARVIGKLTYTKPIVANMAVSGPLKESLVVEKYITKDFQGRKVGIIGYILPETSYLSSPGEHVKFSAVVPAVRAAAEELKTAGVNVIVALGHAGIDTDIAICKEIPEVDVVVGGHTNTFLYNGEYPEGATIKEPRYGAYPLTYRNKNCLVVQAFAYGKYMGNLKVTFDDAGQVKSYEGNPVLLWGEDTAQDPTTLAELKEFSKKVEEFGKKVVGKTNRVLDGQRTNCRTKECEMGNIGVDATLAEYRSKDKSVVCAFIGSGGVRASIDAGEITYQDVLLVFPFGNTIDRAAVRGSVLKEVLEWGVVNFTATGENEEGKYLQVAGLKVWYNVTLPKGSRVLHVEIQDENGDYSVLKDSTDYQCVSNNYLFAGGDGFTMLRDVESVSGRPDVSVMIDFMKEHNPLDDYSGIQNLPQRSFFDKPPPSSALTIVTSWLVMALVAAFVN